MTPIQDRLRASVRFDAVNGDAYDRALVERQMEEAAATIERLEREAEQRHLELIEALRACVLMGTLPPAIEAKATALLAREDGK